MAQRHNSTVAAIETATQPKCDQATQATNVWQLYRFSSGTERSLEMAYIHNKCVQRSLQ